MLPRVTRRSGEDFRCPDIPKLFGNDMIMQALGTTILLAAGAAFCVYDPWNHGVYRYAWYAQTHPRLGSWGLTNIPMLNADIVTGVALMLLFSRFISLKLLDYADRTYHVDHSLCSFCVYSQRSCI